MSVEDTLKERGGTHGNWISQSSLAAELKAVMHCQKKWKDGLSFSQQEALDIIAVKIARILTGNPDEPDHWHDIAGYATLAENSIGEKQ
jgi:uncharacterized protein DUF6378